MKLSRILVTIISLLWVMILVGTLSISIHNSQEYLANQMQSLSQDTATSLGLSLTTSVEQGDLATTHSMVDAIFDRGYYRHIVIRNISGKVMVERTQPVLANDVPAWFTRTFKLEIPRGEALIMHGWKQVGMVEVESHPGHAYKELWRISAQAFWWTLATGIVALVAVLFAMRFALAPLAEMEAQALGISRRQFAPLKKLPWARELQRIAEAMNTMCNAVERMLGEQTALTERMRSKAYLDGVTGLANGRYFDERLHHLTNSPEELSSGALFIIRLENFKEYNEKFGHAAGNTLLKQAAEYLALLCSKHEGSLLARMNGAEFAILIPDIEQDVINTLADCIVSKLSELHKSADSRELSVPAYCGVASYHTGQNASSLLAAADAALRSAIEKGGPCWQPYSSEERDRLDTLSFSQWRERLLSAMHSGQIVLHFQAIVAAHDRSPMHFEALARISAQDGSLLAASAFMPIARELGLAQEIDKYIVEKVLSHMNTNGQIQHTFAINLSPASLRDENTIEWLCSKLMADKAVAQRLIFETAESAVIADVPAARRAIQRIREAGARFSIDRFGHSAASFGYLRTLQVNFIKIDGSYIRNIARNEDSQFFVQSLAGIAHGLEICVIAEYVETEEDYNTLKTLPVDGMQGYYLGRPA